jgi:hypothetical protein
VGPALDWEQVAKRALSDLVVARDALDKLKQLLRSGSFVRLGLLIHPLRISAPKYA